MLRVSTVCPLHCLSRGFTHMAWRQGHHGTFRCALYSQAYGRHDILAVKFGTSYFPQAAYPKY